MLWYLYVDLSMVSFSKFNKLKVTSIGVTSGYLQLVVIRIPYPKGENWSPITEGPMSVYLSVCPFVRDS